MACGTSTLCPCLSFTFNVPSFLLSLAYFLAVFVFILFGIYAAVIPRFSLFLVVFKVSSALNTHTHTGANLRSTRDKTLPADRVLKFFVHVFAFQDTHKRSSVQRRSGRESLCVCESVCSCFFALRFGVQILPPLALLILLLALPASAQTLKSPLSRARSHTVSWFFLHALQTFCLPLTVVVCVCVYANDCVHCICVCMRRRLLPIHLTVCIFVAVVVVVDVVVLAVAAAFVTTCGCDSPELLVGFVVRRK